MDSGATRWQDKITVIITTSPVQSNPSTSLIETVIQSFEFVEGLDECRKIIVCDGMKVMDDTRPLWKSGRVNSEHVDLYAQYKVNLQSLATEGKGQFKNTELLCLSERHGFGHGVLAAVNITTTEFVLVIQHDRRFNRRVHLASILKDMDLNHSVWVDYVSGLLHGAITDSDQPSEAIPYALTTTPTDATNTTHTPTVPFTRGDLMRGRACPVPIPYPPFVYTGRFSTTGGDQDNSHDQLTQPQHDDGHTQEEPEHDRNNRLYGDVSRFMPQESTSVSVPSTNPRFMYEATQYNHKVAQGESPSDLLSAANIPRYCAEYPRPLPVNYVCLPSTYTHTYALRVGRFNIKAGMGSLPAVHHAQRLIDRVCGDVDNTETNGDDSTDNNIPVDSTNTDGLSELPILSPRLVPMLYWFDSTHVARTDYYRSTLFNRWKNHKLELVRVGEFIEDKLIQLATAVLAESMKSKEDNNNTSTTSNANSTVDTTSPDTASTDSNSNENIRPRTGDPWRDFGCSTQTKNLQLLGTSVCQSSRSTNLYAAHHVLQQEFGMWLLEDFDGATYTNQGNWMEPQWLHDQKIKYAQRVHDRAEQGIKLLQDYNPLGRFDLVYGNPDNTANSDYVVIPKGYAFTQAGKPYVGHLDGKAFWTNEQRSEKGYSMNKPA